MARRGRYLNRAQRAEALLKHPPIKRLTRAEWDALHPDYKRVDEDGLHWVLELDPHTQSTNLVAVTVEES